MRRSHIIAWLLGAFVATSLLVAGLATVIVGAASLIGDPSSARSSEVAETARPLAGEERPVLIATLPCSTDLQAKSTGYLIDDRTVVTVAHAIHDSRDFAVRDVSGRWYVDVEVRHLDRDRDLAVLRVPGLAADPAVLRVATAGEPVSLVGGAASGTVTGTVLRRVRMTTAIVGDLSQTAERRGYELDIEVKPGDSGAGVIDGDGNLVGLVFARSTRRDASWAISSAEVHEVLDRDDRPQWDCDRVSDATLVLAPLEPDDPH